MKPLLAKANMQKHSRQLRLLFLSFACLIPLYWHPANNFNISSLSELSNGVSGNLSDDRLKTDVSSIDKCRTALESSSFVWDQDIIPIRERILVVYHVGFLTPSDSFEMNANNVRTFMSSLSVNALFKSTFIIINIIGGMYNPLKAVLDEYNLPRELSCMLMWSYAKSDLLTHALTLAVLYQELRWTFRAFIFLNNGVRGPMVKRRDWVIEFRNHMDEVALTGPILSCEIQPHVPTHMFAFSIDILDLFLKVELHSNENETWSQIVRNYEIGLSQTVLESGRKIGSMLHKNRWNEHFFNGTCRPELGKSNVSFYCEPFYLNSIFIKYGGEFYRQGLFCDSVLSDVDAVTSQILNL